MSSEGISTTTRGRSYRDHSEASPHRLCASPRRDLYAADERPDARRVYREVGRNGGRARDLLRCSQYLPGPQGRAHDQHVDSSCRLDGCRLSLGRRDAELGVAAAARCCASSILEANLSQTIGSASSSVASGAIFTLPALYMWGLTPAWRQLTLLALCGGMLGVLIMIPLRRILIREEHGKLPYPEGMACAEVLVAAEAGGRQASGVFAGIGAGMLFELLTSGLKIVPGNSTGRSPGRRRPSSPSVCRRR